MMNDLPVESAGINQSWPGPAGAAPDKTARKAGKKAPGAGGPETGGKQRGDEEQERARREEEELQKEQKRLQKLAKLLAPLDFELGDLGGSGVVQQVGVRGTRVFVPTESFFWGRVSGSFAA